MKNFVQRGLFFCWEWSSIYRKGIPTVIWWQSDGSKIGDTSLVCSFRRIPRGGIEQNQFDSLVELVRSVTIVPSADRWNWNLESTGIFSVASARRRIDEICLPNIGEETRWVKCVPIKINVLAWKIKTDALPTRFNISRRGIDIQDMSCPICDNAIESTDHLFFRCGLVRDIANKVLSWWNLDHANLNSYAEWKSWLVSIRMNSKLKKMFEGVWYSIWWSRRNIQNVVKQRVQVTRRVDMVFDGAFGGVRDEEVVVREGVVVISSSLDMLTNSYLGGIMVSLIFLEGLDEEAFVEFMVEWCKEDEDNDRNGEDDLFN
ncbi:RNA-directed DNA polymerase, eukaryota [Tanacetum coccineum]|uniref:RNA-directed DNA polymerase, eukaryota n=1 Tax=Tanacetum coccineum TaxID=301880 RepID=A0ABQ5IL58_9ASTR